MPHLVQRMSIVLTATTAVLAAAVPAAAAPPVDTGKLIQLESLGGVGSYGRDMNQRGDIVGASVDAADNYRAVVWRHGERAPTPLGVEGAQTGVINEKGHIAGHVEGGLFLWRDGAVTYLRQNTVSWSGQIAINDHDQVAATGTDQNEVSHAYLWQRGRMTALPTPAGTSSRTVDINNRGQVLGSVTGPGDTAERAVLWQDGRMTELGTLGGAGSVPVAINERGQVIGNSAVRNGPFEPEHPFLWQRGRMTDLLAGTDATGGRVVALSDTGMMTGNASYGDDGGRTVLWRDGRMIDIGLPGHTGIGAYINDRGDVAGPTWPDPQSTSVPFRWSNGRTTLFPEPAGDIASAILGIDRAGDIGIDLETSPFGNLVLRSA